MGRWGQLDTDEERLPHGVRRVGYDTDTQKYTYRDKSGTMYESAPGVQYGRLYRIGTVPASAATNPFRAPSETSATSVESLESIVEGYEYFGSEKRPPTSRSPPTTFSQIFANAEGVTAVPRQENKDVEEKPSRARSVRYRQRRDTDGDASQQLPKRRQSVRKFFQT